MATGNLLEGYGQFRLFLRDSGGIELGENKHYLFESRLSRLLHKHAISTLLQLVGKIQLESNQALKQAVIDAMSTSETLWFRDGHPFDIVKNHMLPELYQVRDRPLKIWSTACPPGQESYSLSVLVQEYVSANSGCSTNPVDILATDLSASIIAACRRAQYDRLSIGRGLSQQRLMRFFTPLMTIAGR